MQELKELYNGVDHTILFYRLSALTKAQNRYYSLHPNLMVGLVSGGISGALVALVPEYMSIATTPGLIPLILFAAIFTIALFVATLVGFSKFIARHLPSPVSTAEIALLSEMLHL